MERKEVLGVSEREQRAKEGHRTRWKSRLKLNGWKEERRKGWMSVETPGGGQNRQEAGGCDGPVILQSVSDGWSNEGQNDKSSPERKESSMKEPTKEPCFR